MSVRDKLGLWSVGGILDRTLPRWVGFTRGSRGSTTTSHQVASVNTMIMERHNAKKRRGYNTVDRIRVWLRSAHDVRPDDKNRTWRVDSATYVRVYDPGTAEISQNGIDTVTHKISERHARKVERDYVKADSIRDKLVATYGVEIDDEIKQWKFVLPAVGEGEEVIEIKKVKRTSSRSYNVHIST